MKSSLKLWKCFWLAETSVAVVAYKATSWPKPTFAGSWWLYKPPFQVTVQPIQNIYFGHEHR